MEKRKLVIMVDLVLDKDNCGVSVHSYLEVRDYAAFLRKPLTLGMFIPVSESGEVLEEPKHYNEWLSELNKGFEHEYEGQLMKAYTKAKSRCIFEGWQVIGHDDSFTEIELTDKNLWISFYKDSLEITDDSTFEDILETIEDLVPYGLTLTENSLR